MKNTRECPKCKETNICRICGFVKGERSIEPGRNIIMTGKTLMSAVPVTRYICRSCRFTEEWIDSEKDIKQI